MLKGGDTIHADVIVGADGKDLMSAPIGNLRKDRIHLIYWDLGLWSGLRNVLLGKNSPPTETGDLAYRGTFSLAQLQSFNDPRLDELCSRKAVTLWLGPEKHAVFYPVRAGKEFNLVLVRPDNLPKGERQAEGDIAEMRDSFDGWDPM